MKEREIEALAESIMNIEEIFERKIIFRSFVRKMIVYLS